MNSRAAFATHFCTFRFHIKALPPSNSALTLHLTEMQIPFGLLSQSQLRHAISRPSLSICANSPFFWNPSRILGVISVRREEKLWLGLFSCGSVRREDPSSPGSLRCSWCTLKDKQKGKGPPSLRLEWISMSFTHIEFHLTSWKTAGRRTPCHTLRFLKITKKKIRDSVTWILIRFISSTPILCNPK